MRDDPVAPFADLRLPLRRGRFLASPWIEGNAFDAKRGEDGASTGLARPSPSHTASDDGDLSPLDAPGGGDRPRAALDTPT